MRISIGLALLLAASTAQATETTPSATDSASTQTSATSSPTATLATTSAPSLPASTDRATTASSARAVANGATHADATPHAHRARTSGASATATVSDATASHGSNRRSRHHEPPPRPPSASLGYANSGRLVNPSRLEEDETLRYVPGRPLHYGTDELIGLIRRSARSVYRRHHTRLSVGDLSAAGGGPVGHHASHQSGRDADIGFYITNAHGEPVLLDDYVCFRRDGMPFVNGPYRFDTARNWALLEAMLTDPAVTVEHVFVSNGLRSLLIHYARNHGADASIIARAESTLVQPPRGSPHTNHFHVRIACPAGDASCVEGVHRVFRRRRHPHAVAGAGPARPAARVHRAGGS